MRDVAARMIKEILGAVITNTQVICDTEDNLEQFLQTTELKKIVDWNSPTFEETDTARNDMDPRFTTRKFFYLDEESIVYEHSFKRISRSGKTTSTKIVKYIIK